MKKNILLLGGGRQLGYYIIKKFNTKKNNFYIYNRSNLKILSSHNIKSNQLIIGDRNIFENLEKIPRMNWYSIIDTSCYDISSLKLIKKLNLNYKNYYFFSSIYVQKNKYIKLRKDLVTTQQEKLIYNYIEKKKNCENYLRKNFNDVTIIRPSPILSLKDHTNRIIDWIGHVYHNNYNIKYKDYKFSLCSASFVSENFFNDKKSFRTKNILGSTFTYLEFYEVIKLNIKLLLINFKLNNNIPDIKTPPFIENNTVYYGIKENKNSFISKIII